MTPTLRVTIDVDNQVLGSALSFYVSMAIVLAVFDVGLLVFGTDAWLAIGAGAAGVLVLFAYGRAPWAATAILLDLVRLRRCLATPHGHAMLLRATLTVALDRIDAPDAPDTQGLDATAEVEWACRTHDLYPLLVRLTTAEDGGSGGRAFVDNQAAHVLAWDAFGFSSPRAKPFALHATVGPIPTGYTAHARMQRASMRVAA